MKAEFIKSASNYRDCIVSDLPQIAVAGKSNSGKSSFINLLMNSNLARTSREPGRTRLINYFLIDEKYFLTDLPGYGYAKVSLAEKKKWGELIEEYLEKEKMLLHLFFLIDIRRDPTHDDVLLLNYLYKRGLGFTLIATKADKIAKSKIFAEKQRLASLFKIGRDDIIATSAETKYGREETLARLDRIIASARLDETELERMEEDDRI